MLRISLIIVIIACLAAAAVNFMQVKEKITTTLTNLDETTKDRDKEKADHRKFEKLAKDTQTKLDSTTKELTDTKTERDTAVANSEEQTKKATAATEKLKQTAAERDDAKNLLAAWEGLGIKIENIRTTLGSLKKVTDQRDVFAAENGVLLKKNQHLQDRLDIVLNPDKDVILPEGLKGEVLVADPKYDFVVLNIGEQQGARELGKMLVNRKGKLIAKVQIKSVQADRCIANVLPGWKMDEIMEGDQVVY